MSTHKYRIAQGTGPDLPHLSSRRWRRLCHQQGRHPIRHDRSPLRDPTIRAHLSRFALGVNLPPAFSLAWFCIADDHGASRRLVPSASSDPANAIRFLEVVVLIPIRVESTCKNDVRQLGDRILLGSIVTPTK